MTKDHRGGKAVATVTPIMNLSKDGDDYNKQIQQHLDRNTEKSSKLAKLDKLNLEANANANANEGQIAIITSKRQTIDYGYNEEDDDDDEDDDERNLDAGYAWIILVVMFLLNATVGGSSRVYGLVYAKQVSIDYYDHEQASWPIATASTIENLAGILTPALAQFLTWRKIQMLSTSLFILANLGAYFSGSLLIDILCLGVIQGLALSINTVLALAINNDYFERYRTTAYGISISGSTCGILVMGPVVSWILEDYDQFRYAYLAIAAFFGLNIVLVLFVVPRRFAPDALVFWRHRKGSANNNKSSTNSMAWTSALKYTNKKMAPGEGKGKGGTKKGCLPSRRVSSRLASHFERKDSIASISVQCRISRQSTWSRNSSDWRKKSVRATNAAAQSSIATATAAATFGSDHIDGAAGGGRIIVRSVNSKDIPFIGGSKVPLTKKVSTASLQQQHQQQHQHQQQVNIGDLPPIYSHHEESGGGGGLPSAECGHLLVHVASNNAFAAHLRKISQVTGRGAVVSCVQEQATAKGNEHETREQRKSTVSFSSQAPAGVDSEVAGHHHHHQNHHQQQQQHPVATDNVPAADHKDLEAGSNTKRSRLVMRDSNEPMAAAVASHMEQPQVKRVASILRTNSTTRGEETKDAGVKEKEINDSMVARTVVVLAAEEDEDKELGGRGNESIGVRAKGGGGGGGESPSFSLRQALELLKLPYLHCVWIMLTLYYLIARIFIIILTDFADDHGLDMSQSRQLLNFWSLGEIIGRIFLSSVIDLQWLSVKSCIVFTCTALASSITLMISIEGLYSIYALGSALIAAFVSLEYMLINVLMVEYVGKERVLGIYSLGSLVSSLILFGRPALIGYFRDQLGSYDGLLLLLATLTLSFAILFFLFEPAIVRRWPKPTSTRSST